VRGLFVAEAAFMGASGAALGALTGAAMGLVVTWVIGVQSTGWRFDFRLPWRLVAQMALAAIVCAVIAGLYPARRASRLEVVEALAYE
jgi:putative ABC transport system permease protein